MLEVREQAKLPFRRIVEICLDSISYRLLRSVVTVFIIVVAIAFLATIMADGYLGQAVRNTVQGHTRRFAAYTRFLSSVSRAPADEGLILFAGRAQPGSADWENLKAWGGFDDPAASEFTGKSRAVHRMIRFFEQMSVGKRVLLVRQNMGVEIFDWLQDPENRKYFYDKLEPMKTLRLPGGNENFEAFLGAWPSYREKLDRIHAAYRETVARIWKKMGNVPQALRRAAEEERVEAFFQNLAELGYRIDADAVAHIIDGLQYQDRISKAFEFLNQRLVRNGWNREFQEKFSPGSALRALNRTPERFNWIQRVMTDPLRTEIENLRLRLKTRDELLAKAREGVDATRKAVSAADGEAPAGSATDLAAARKALKALETDLSAIPDRIGNLQEKLEAEKEAIEQKRPVILAAAAEYSERQSLLEAEQELVGRYGDEEGLSEKTVWLIAVSFVVCVVGIANAMLMSVLERFKEIATMKCLGARNNSIAVLFIFESLIVGIAGGAAGIVAGFIIIIVRQTLAYGGLLYANFPAGDLAYSFGICFLCSMLLATLAAIYPARVASRMAPMEAMRID